MRSEELHANGSRPMLEIGASLREARHRLQLELAEVEAVILIKSRYLDALEHDRFHQLPPGSYRIVFLREYAEFLGLDGNLLVDEYLLRSAPPREEPPPERPRPCVSIDELAGWVTPLRAAVAVAAVVFALAVWQLGSGGTPAPATTAVTTSPRPPVHHARLAPPARRPSRTTVAAHAPAAIPLAAARGDCWILIRRGSSGGPVVYQGMLAQGGRLRLALTRPLWIRFGAPWNLNAAIAGRSVNSTLPSRTGDVLATASGLRATA